MRWSRNGGQVLYQTQVCNSKNEWDSKNVARIYPAIRADDKEQLRITEQLLSLFALTGDLPAGRRQRVLLQLQRVTAAPGSCSKPSAEGGWHQDGVRRIGIVCVARENIVGGVNMFSDLSRRIMVQRQLLPGHMAVFADAEAFHCVTDILSADGISEGHRDVMLMSF